MSSNTRKKNDLSKNQFHQLLVKYYIDIMELLDVTSIGEIIIKNSTIKFESNGVSILISHYSKGSSAIKVHKYSSDASGPMCDFADLLCFLFQEQKGDDVVPGVEDYYDSKKYYYGTTTRIKFIINNIDIEELTKKLEDTVNAIKLSLI